MDYLVTMTTRVPDGTSEETVADIRTREATRARELAAQGHLLRLWRPPLQPGEWRTLGLFAATDRSRLEDILVSMPLRVWRTDEVVALAPHPNDPQIEPKGGAVEFLIALNIVVPEGTPVSTVADTKTREAERAHELAEQGYLVRLWTPPAEPGEWRVLGLWRAADAAAMEAILESLPLHRWMTAEITPLAQHPNDPGITTPGWR
ncbi:MAG: muconolactone Delta-isomerase family protein [Candidatus Dormiibacterota bacterium]